MSENTCGRRRKKEGKKEESKRRKKRQEEKKEKKEKNEKNERKRNGLDIAPCAIQYFVDVSRGRTMSKKSFDTPIPRMFFLN
jgi:hypothetical protein